MTRPGPRGRRRRILVGLALALPALLAPRPAAAQERRLSLESFNATLTVEPSGLLDVLEELQFRFDGSWNGVFRTIPVRYDMGSEIHRVRLDVVDVRGGDGSELRYETSRQGAYRKVKIWVPGASDATRTVVLHYRVRDALRFFENHDELYWNVTGNEWDFPVGRASARVVLPDGATGRRATAYTGTYGARGEDASVTEIEEGYYFQTTNPLEFREGLTVVVGWDPGLVHRPSALERALRAGVFLLIFPLISLVGMWRLWSARGRDPERRPVAPRYEPPGGMTPAEVGTLVDNSPDMRDFTATIVDLAVRGYLRIEEEERSGLVKIFSRQEYTFHRLKEAGPELKPHETALLDALFSGGIRSVVSTSELEHEFYKEIPGLKHAVFRLLLESGDYRNRPDKVLQTWLVVGVLACILATVGLVVVASARGYDMPFALAGGIGFGLPVLIFGVLMPARTVSGTRRLEEILGFEEFLDRVESDRFRRMIKGPEQFEAFLPYAMALSVEERWARAFEDLYTEPPTWYTGRYPGTFRPSMLVSNLSTMSTRASSAMSSAPRSSGGSGFSSGGGGGGGFSGGGFGGGGGGGF